MRVLKEKIEYQEAYEYLSGLQGQQEIWSSNYDNALTIVESPVGELSVIWNEYIERWIMSYLNEKNAFN